MRLPFSGSRFEPGGTFIPPVGGAVVPVLFVDGSLCFLVVVHHHINPPIAAKATSNIKFLAVNSFFISEMLF